MAPSDALPQQSGYVLVPWAERVQRAWDAWNHWYCIPGRFRMDRALKSAGVRQLIADRDRHRAALVEAQEALYEGSIHAATRIVERALRDD